jgi:hypothetical protein
VPIECIKTKRLYPSNTILSSFLYSNVVKRSYKYRSINDQHRTTNRKSQSKVKYSAIYSAIYSLCWIP